MPRVEVQFDGVSRGAVNAARQTRMAIRGVGDEGDRTAKRIGFMGRIIRYSLVRAAYAGGAGLLALGGAVGFVGFKFDNLKQQAQIAFTTMLGSGQKAQRFLLELQKFAARTPFEFPDLIRASQRLLAMGFNAKSIVPTLTAVGNAVAGLGGDPVAMDATIRAIGQIQAKGRLMAEEMMQLNEAGTFSWKALAFEIGKSVPEAMALVQKGAVTSEIFLEAFARNSDRRFKGMMDKQSQTFGGLLSTLKDMFSQFAGVAMKPLFDLTTRGMKGIVNANGEVQASAQRTAHEFGVGLANAVKSVVIFFRSNWPEIREFILGSWTAARALATALRTVARAAKAVSDVIGGWSNLFKLVLTLYLANKFLSLAAAIAKSRLALLLLGRTAPKVAATVVLAEGEMAAGAATLTSRLAAARAMLLSLLGPIALVGAALATAKLAWDRFNPEGIAADVVRGDNPYPVGTAQHDAWERGRSGKKKTKAIRTGGQNVRDAFAAGRAAQAGGRPAGPAGPGGALGATGAGLGKVTLAPGADRAGVPTKAHVVTFVRYLAAAWGGPLTIGTGTNHNQGVQGSGNQSDHWTGDAADIPMSGANLTRLGQTALMVAGANPDWAYKQTGGAFNVGGVNILFNTNIGGNHFNHLHVGLKSLPASLSRRGGGTSVTGGDPPIGGFDLGGGAGGTGGSSRRAGPQRADPAERRRDLAGVSWLEAHIPKIAPQLRARIRRELDAIAEAVKNAKTEAELRKATSRLEALKKKFNDALILTGAIAQARKSAKAIAREIARLPEAMRVDLERRMEAVRDGLAKVVSARSLAKLRKELERIHEAVLRALDKMQQAVDERRDVFAGVFGKLADKALSVFDAKTQDLLSKARAFVAQFGFEIGVGEDTPTEALLKQRGEQQAGQQEAERIADLERQLAAAQDGEERARLQRELSDARFDAETRRLEKQAEAERKAADAALEAERKRIQDERDALREKFVDRLNEIQARISQGDVSASQAQAMIAAAMAEFGIDAKTAADLIGPAFMATLTAAMSDTTKAIVDLIAAIDDLAKATRDPKSTPAGGHALRPPDHAQHGGRVPGRYVGRDSVPFMLTPGEEILDRSLSHALRAYLAGGGGRVAPLADRIYVLGTTEREVAAALAKMIEAPQAERISYTIER